MNGDDIEYKTVGIYRVKNVTFVLNLTSDQLSNGINEITAYQGFTITIINTANGPIVGQNAGSITVTSQIESGSTSVGTWQKMVSLKINPNTAYRYVTYIYEAIGMINSLESIYQLETPRYTDVIWKRYIMTDNYTGQWLSMNPNLGAVYSPEVTNYTLSIAGVLGCYQT